MWRHLWIFPKQHEKTYCSSVFNKITTYYSRHLKAGVPKTGLFIALQGSIRAGTEGRNQKAEYIKTKGWINDQVVIAQWLVWPLAIGVVPGSNLGKGYNLIHFWLKRKFNQFKFEKHHSVGLWTNWTSIHKQVIQLHSFKTTIIDFWNFKHFWISKARLTPSSRVASPGDRLSKFYVYS